MQGQLTRDSWTESCFQAYVGDMVISSAKVDRHIFDLEELFATISRHNLKPDKCVFGVQAGKFLGFLLTKRGIEENLDNCAAFMEMRSPTNVKEVQRLTGRMVALSFFYQLVAIRGILISIASRRTTASFGSTSVKRLLSS